MKMVKKKIYLSYPLNNQTPTYGNRMRVVVSKLKSKKDGSTVNESMINLPLHSGTHIDFPYHFFEDGAKHENFGPEFWFFKNPLIIEISQKYNIIEESLLEKLKEIESKDRYDLLLIKTGSSEYRNQQKYWKHNFGLSPKIATYLRSHFKNVRIVGMDFISLSSFQHSDVGKEAHLEFLKPDSPILVVEDMDLKKINSDSNLTEVIISPTRIDGVDGAPVTCFAEVSN
jgi:kynurenine formamidase